MLLRKAFCNAAYIIDKAHIQHTVGFIKNKSLDIRKINDSFPHKIHKPARSRNKDIGTTAEMKYLWAGLGTTIDAG